jgi:hypothetical protein
MGPWVRDPPNAKTIKKKNYLEMCGGELSAPYCALMSPKMCSHAYGRVAQPNSLVLYIIRAFRVSVFITSARRKCFPHIYVISINGHKAIYINEWNGSGRDAQMHTILKGQSHEIEE